MMRSQRHTFIGAPPDVRSTGGKAYNLSILTRNGIPVPRWTSIPVEVCEAAVAPLKSRMGAMIAAADFNSPEDLARVHGAMREALLGTDFPCATADALQAWIAESEPTLFAVRSSALGEDSVRDSYAGMFDTYLYTPPELIIQRIKECWASAFNPRILSYIRRKGLNPLDTRMGVIVQEMVESRVSGVLFQANPTGPITEAVIVAGYGLGEGIVSDRVETDTFHVDMRTGVVRSRIAEKHSQIVYDAIRKEGTRAIDVPREERDKPALSEGRIRELLRTGDKIRALYDRHQDIEWAFDRAGRLFITQSRAITTIPRGPQSIFDNSNIVEGYPGVTAPLTFSFIRAAYETIFRNLAVRLGLSQRILEAHQTLFPNMVAYIEGRVYYGLHNWYTLFNLFPIGKLYAPSFEEMAGIREKAAPSASAGFSLTDIPGYVRFFGCFFRAFLTLERLMRDFKDNFRAQSRRFGALDLNRMTNHALITEYHTAFAALMNGWEVTLFFDMFAVIFSSLARALLKRSGIDERLFNDLLCAEEGMESVEPVRSLVRMTEMVRGDAKLQACLEDILAQPDPDQALMRFLNETNGFPAFCTALQRHLDAYGDRAVEELKLESKVYRDCPAPLVRTVLSFVPLNLTVEGMLAREKGIREQAERRLSQALGRKPLRRIVFAFTIRHARRAVLYRESSRLDRARAYGIVRTLFTRIGANLQEEGVIDSVDDIFFLTVEEIESYIRGTSVNARLRWIVEQRRAQHRQFQQKKPAERIVLQGTVYTNFIPQAAGDGDTPAQDVIRGTGCCPGIVEAEAIVVRDPHAMHAPHDKILVAEMTDPGWVFLMLAAKGLIVEKGSLLSHTAIIGRELGIPTIVGVKGATRLIPDGARVRMNGQTGEISVCED